MVLTFLKRKIELLLISACYVHILQNFLLPDLQWRQVNLGDLLFQQDGVTAYSDINGLCSSNVSSTCHFPFWRCSPWLPRSFVLSACDIIVWGAKVYANKPCTLPELKIATHQVITRVPQEMIDYQQRLEMGDREGGWQLTATLLSIINLKVHYYYSFCCNWNKILKIKTAMLTWQICL